MASSQMNSSSKRSEFLERFALAYPIVLHRQTWLQYCCKSCFGCFLIILNTLSYFIRHSKCRMNLS